MATEDIEFANNTPQPTFRFTSQPTFLTISNLVSINMENGEITFLEGYEPSEAAKVFWSCLVTEYKEYLKWKESNG